MAFDTSNVAATVGQGVAPINPLDTIEKLAATRNALNQNRLFQSQQAAGQAFQGAIGPDGTFDQNALMTGLANNPQAALAAQAAAQSGATLQGTGISNVTAQQAQAAARIGRVQTLLGAIPPGPNQRAQAEALLNQQVAAGSITPDDAANVSGGNIPGMPNIATQAQVGAVASGSEADQAAQFGTPTVISTGGANDVEAINRVTGTVSPLGAPIPNTLTPAERNTAAFTRFNPATGQMETVTQAQAAAVPPTGPIPSAPPLGAEAAANTAGAGSAQQLTAAHQDAATATGRILALRKALTGIQNSQTGPGSQEVNNVKSFFQAMAPGMAKTLGVNPDEVKNYDEANKYLTQYAAGSATAYGPGTDQKLATAASGNASTHISNLAAQDVIKVSIGIERMKQAQVAAFDAAGQPGGPGNFGTWSAHWAQTVDPRAFMLDIMPKADRAKMLSTVTTPAGKRAMLAGKAAAEQVGQFGEGDIPQ